MGGGGGDGGYQARQDSLDRDRAASRARLNALFGIAPSGPDAAGQPVSRDAFTRETAATQDQDGATSFDQSGFDAATAASAGGAAGLSGEAAKNRAALDALYGKVRTDAFTAGKRRVDEQQQGAARNLRFELFARGQDGGSVDVDQNALLGRTYAQGITDTGARADGVANQLRSDDTSSRLQLLQAIDSGMDQGSAVSSALEQMRNNANRASSDAIGTAVGDLFSNAGLIYTQNRRSQGRQNPANALPGGNGFRAPAAAATGSLSFSG